MSTDSAASNISASSLSIPDAQQHTESNRTQSDIAHPSRWNWYDTGYLVLLALLVVVMAYRFTPNFSSEIAGQWWDPLLNMWTLSWDTNTLLHAPTHLWQAQLLYPNNLSLSYSENLLGEAVIYAPFFLITHNPVVSYNITFYLIFLLCGVNMYIMARHYTHRSFAAFVAALIFAFAPYRIGQIDHIHIIAGEWMPLAFLYLDLSLEKGRWRHWILFALFYALQLLSSVYYGIFLTYSLLAFVLIRYLRPFVGQLRQHKGEFMRTLIKKCIRPAIVFAVMLTFILLLMAPYLASLHNGFARSVGEATGYSAFIRDFLFAVPFNWLYGITNYNGTLLSYDSEHYLFLGVTTIALTVAGSILALRQKQSTFRAYMWTGVIVLLFAFGPFLQYSTASGGPFVAAASRLTGSVVLPPNLPYIPMPWFLGFYILPGLSGLRVPARLIGVLLIMLAIMAAYCVAWLQNSCSSTAIGNAEGVQKTQASKAPPESKFVPLRIWAIRGVLLLIPILLLLEVIPAYMPVTYVPTGNAIPPVYSWLATHGGQQPIVELPITTVDRNFPPKDEAWYDYYAIYHSHPIVDGWSGYRPPLTERIAALLYNFPSQDSLTILKKYHITYVVLHLQLYSPNVGASILAQAKANPGLRQVASFGSDSVWQVMNLGIECRGLEQGSRCSKPET